MNWLLLPELVGVPSRKPAKPFQAFFTARLMPGEELMEYVCQEDNQDVPYLVGPRQ